MRWLLAAVVAGVVALALVLGAAGSLLAGPQPSSAAVLALSCAAQQRGVGAPAAGAAGALANAAGDAAGNPAGGVAGLSPVQMNNARTVVQVGARLGFPRRGWVVALVVASQESQIKNLASRQNAESLRLPNDGVAPGDRTSVGIVQQQDWWGTTAQRMDVAESMRRFYTGANGNPGLDDVDGWADMPVTVAAQRVQRSAFPGAYAQWEARANAVVEAMVAEGSIPAASPAAAEPAGAPAGPPGGAQAAAAPDDRVVSCTPPVVQATAGGASVAYFGPPGGWTQPEGPGYRVTSPFGMRRHPISGVLRLHAGTDLSSPGCGAPLLAASAGTVTRTSGGWSGGFGNLTVVDHGGGVETYYPHQSRFGVEVGQTVTTGQVIGYEGSTGSSTGCHLHFQIMVNGKAVDPEPFMASRGAPLR